MAKMVIEELPPPGNDLAPIRIEWSRETGSLPTEELPTGWEVIRSRTYDAREVTEQVIGVHAADVHLSGEWRDTWGGSGFAAVQLEAFETLVLRAHPVRLTWGAWSSPGIISQVSIKRRILGVDGKPTRVAWEFVFSPHTLQHTNLAPGVNRRDLPLTPYDMDQQVADQVQALLEAHALAPRDAIKPTVYEQVNTAIVEVASGSDHVRESINSSLLPGVPPDPGAGARIVQAFQSVAAGGVGALAATRAINPAQALAWESSAVWTAYALWNGGIQDACVPLVERARAAAIAYARTLQGGSARGFHRVRRGETLAGIAAVYLADPSRWREIMAINGLRSPVLSGDEGVLVIPR